MYKNNQIENSNDIGTSQGGKIRKGNGSGNLKYMLCAYVYFT